MAQEVEHEGDYDIDEGGMIRISVRVGEGNTGHIRIRRDDVPLGDAQDGLRNVEVGPASEIEGQSMVVLASVSHVNPNSLRTSVTHELTGGAAPETVLLEEEAEEPGAVIDYRAEFHLVRRQDG